MAKAAAKPLQGWCPKCGKSLALVGLRHNCVPRADMEAAAVAAVTHRDTSADAPVTHRDKSHSVTRPKTSKPKAKRSNVTHRDAGAQPEPASQSHSVTPLRSRADALVDRLLARTSLEELEAFADGRRKLVTVGGQSPRERKRRSRERKGATS